MGRGASVLRRAAGALSQTSKPSAGLAAPAAAAAGFAQSRGIFNLFSSPAPTGPPMTDPLPGITASSPAPMEASPPGTQVTTLANGVKVATENTFGPTATLGIYVDAGRCEIITSLAYPSGSPRSCPCASWHPEELQGCPNPRPTQT